MAVADQQWSFGFIWNFLLGNSGFFLSAAIGVILIIIYWAQSNALLGNLARSDVKHASTADNRPPFNHPPASNSPATNCCGSATSLYSSP